MAGFFAGETAVFAAQAAVGVDEGAAGDAARGTRLWFLDETVMHA